MELTPTNPKKRGGWTNPASAENGRKATGGGRPRKKLIVHHGETAVILRDGDEVSVIDAGGPHIATVRIVDGALKLVNDQGQSLTIVISE